MKTIRAPRRRVGKNRIIDAVFCSPLKIVPVDAKHFVAYYMIVEVKKISCISFLSFMSLSLSVVLKST